jgi:hypothetical protein
MTAATRSWTCPGCGMTGSIPLDASPELCSRCIASRGKATKNEEANGEQQAEDLETANSEVRLFTSTGQFTIRQNRVLGFVATYRVYDTEGNVIGFWKGMDPNAGLKSLVSGNPPDDFFRVYTDARMEKEVLRVSWQQMFGVRLSPFDVIDATTREKAGSFKAHPVKKMLQRVSWSLMDENGDDIGTLHETCAAMPLLSRLLARCLHAPRYQLSRDGTVLAEFRMHRNPLVKIMTVTTNPDCRLHPALILMAAIIKFRS